jgi:hypothetical protein
MEGGKGLCVVGIDYLEKRMQLADEFLRWLFAAAVESVCLVFSVSTGVRMSSYTSRHAVSHIRSNIMPRSMGVFRGLGISASGRYPRQTGACARGRYLVGWLLLVVNPLFTGSLLWHGTAAFP